MAKWCAARGLQSAPPTIATGCSGVLQKLEHRLDRAGIGLFGERRDARAVERLDLVAQHVLGQREHDRAGAAGGRDAIGAGDIFGDAPRILDPRRPFGDRAEEGGKVDLLEALAVAVAARDVADEQDHRGRILEGDMDAAAGVGRAGAAGDEGDARAAGHLAVGVGHVGDAAFLPADDRCRSPACREARRAPRGSFRPER